MSRKGVLIMNGFTLFFLLSCAEDEYYNLFPQYGEKEYNYFLANYVLLCEGKLNKELASV